MSLYIKRERGGGHFPIPSGALPVPFRYPSGVRAFGLPLSARINAIPFPFRCAGFPSGNAS